MSDNTKIALLNEFPVLGVDLNLAIEQARKITDFLDSIGIEKATFKSGGFFHRDESTNTATVAKDGLIVQQREHSTSVTVRHEGSSERQALEELNNTTMTQEVLGAFSDRSQPWVSRVLSKEENDK